MPDGNCAPGADTSAASTEVAATSGEAITAADILGVVLDIVPNTTASAAASSVQGASGGREACSVITAATGTAPVTSLTPTALGATHPVMDEDLVSIAPCACDTEPVANTLAPAAAPPPAAAAAAAAAVTQFATVVEEEEEERIVWVPAGVSFAAAIHALEASAVVGGGSIGCSEAGHAQVWPALFSVGSGSASLAAAVVNRDRGPRHTRRALDSADIFEVDSPHTAAPRPEAMYTVTGTNKWERRRQPVNGDADVSSRYSQPSLGNNNTAKSAGSALQASALNTGRLAVFAGLVSDFSASQFNDSDGRAAASTTRRGSIDAADTGLPAPLQADRVACDSYALATMSVASSQLDDSDTYTASRTDHTGAGNDVASAGVFALLPADRIRNDTRQLAIDGNLQVTVTSASITSGATSQKPAAPAMLHAGGGSYESADRLAPFPPSLLPSWTPPPPRSFLNAATGGVGKGSIMGGYGLTITTDHAALAAAITTAGIDRSAAAAALSAMDNGWMGSSVTTNPGADLNVVDGALLSANAGTTFTATTPHPTTSNAVGKGSGNAADSSVSMGGSTAESGLSMVMCEDLFEPLAVRTSTPSASSFPAFLDGRQDSVDATPRQDQDLAGPSAYTSSLSAGMQPHEEGGAGASTSASAPNATATAPSSPTARKKNQRFWKGLLPKKFPTKAIKKVMEAFSKAT
ncbi:MAG: hypothetical protein WDW38_002127 [Sanguina aurantia]